MRRSTSQVLIIGVALASSLALASGTLAQSSGKASVDGKTQTDVKGAGNLAVAKGVSVAGVRLKTAKEEDTASAIRSQTAVALPPTLRSSKTSKES